MRTRKIILTGLFAALTAIGAFIRIPTPISSFTLQVFFTCMAGLRRELGIDLIITDHHECKAELPDACHRRDGSAAPGAYRRGGEAHRRAGGRGCAGYLLP